MFGCTKELAVKIEPTQHNFTFYLCLSKQWNQKEEDDLHFQSFCCGNLCVNVKNLFQFIFSISEEFMYILRSFRYIKAMTTSNARSNRSIFLFDRIHFGINKREYKLEKVKKPRHLFVANVFISGQ